MIKIKLDKADLKRLQDKLKRITKLKEPLAQIKDALEASTKLRFNRGVDPEGQPWKPRTEKYKQRLARQGRLTPRVLVVTGKLQKSIQYLSDERKVVVGTNVEYAAAHNFGHKKKPTLPKRQFIGLSELDKERIDEIIEKHIEK